MRPDDFINLKPGTRLRLTSTGGLRIVGVDGHIYDPTDGRLTGNLDAAHAVLYELHEPGPVNERRTHYDQRPATLTNTPRNVRPGDWLNERTSAQRKEIPMARGVLDYFPDALAAIARHSKQGNDKHNPGQPLHWSREKSSDHADCILRHLAGRGGRDSADGSRHSIGLAWRALALLQLEIEEAVAKGEEV